MKMQEALNIIGNLKKEPGYMVSFEHVEGAILRGDYFPDKHAGETLIASEDEAWQLAEAFAEATRGKCVNIYVIDSGFNPVEGYEARTVENRRW